MHTLAILLHDTCAPQDNSNTIEKSELRVLFGDLFPQFPKYSPLLLLPKSIA